MFEIETIKPEKALEIINLADEKLELLKDKDFCKDMFMYELGNHEWQLTGDDNAVLRACGLTTKQVEADKMLTTVWVETKKEYYQKCLDNDWF